jgi:hypothetical protein
MKTKREKGNMEYRVQMKIESDGWVTIETFMDKDRAHNYMLAFDRFNPSEVTRMVPAFI